MPRSDAPNALSTAVLAFVVLAILASTQVPRVQRALTERQNQQADASPPAVNAPVQVSTALQEFVYAAGKLKPNQLEWLRSAGVTEISHHKYFFGTMTAEGGETTVMANGRRYVFHMYTTRDYKSRETVLDLTQPRASVRLSDLPETALDAYKTTKVISSLMMDVRYQLEKRDRDAVYRLTGH